MATGLYCRQCARLTGWWTKKKDDVNYELIAEVANLDPKELTEEEKESLK